MTESIWVTEGLRSAMLSIWLKRCPMLLVWTATHDHRDYIAYIQKCVSARWPGQLRTDWTHCAVFTADMRLVSGGLRVRRAAESSEPESEETTEPAHHEHAHPEHHHEHTHPEHHPGHDYNHMKEKFMNELKHLPSKTPAESTFKRLNSV